MYNKYVLQNRVYFLKKSFHSILQGVAQSKYNFIADSLEELRLLFQGWWEAAVFGSFHHLHMEKILLLDSLKVEIYFPEPQLPAVKSRDFQHWWHMRTRTCILSSSTWRSWQLFLDWICVFLHKGTKTISFLCLMTDLYYGRVRNPLAMSVNSGWAPFL